MANGVGDAVQNFINEKIPGGGMLTGFFTVATYIDNDGETCWAMLQQEDQTLRDGLSLINWAKLDMEFQINRYLEDVYRDREDNE